MTSTVIYFYYFMAGFFIGGILAVIVVGRKQKEPRSQPTITIMSKDDWIDQALDRDNKHP